MIKDFFKTKFNCLSTCFTIFLSFNKVFLLYIIVYMIDTKVL